MIGAASAAGAGHRFAAGGRPGVALWLLAFALAATACGGEQTLPRQPRPAGDCELVASDADGRALGTDAAAVRHTSQGVAIYAQDERARGFELSYDHGRRHVIRVERGAYFGPADLYLAVDRVPGIVAVGGYRLAQDPRIGAEGRLVARVVFGDGPAPRGVSTLPTGASARPLEFDLRDAGDGTGGLAWLYHNVGDYNLDGEVGLGDITPVGVHFDARAGDAGWESALLADGDNNGLVTVSDLTPIGANFLTGISGYKVERAPQESGPYAAVLDVPRSQGEGRPWLLYSAVLAAPQTGSWYRVRAYSADDPGQGAASEALQFEALPAGQNPTAAAGADATSGTAPLTVSFSAAGSHDDDGSIAGWYWSLDGEAGFEIDATATQGAVEHTYTRAGTYRARLKVVDDQGRHDIAALTIYVALPAAESPPQAFAYVMPNQGWAPLTCYFSAFGSSDNGSIAQYLWDLDGDGSFETDATAAGGYAQRTYTTAGDYTATLKLIDDLGSESLATTEVEVRDPALSSVDYRSVFDDSQLRRIDIDIDQQAWEQMWAVPEDKVEVEADVTVFGEDFQQVALSMRGHRSLWDVPEKKPWQIDFNDYVEDQTYHNLKQLLLNNFYQDPSLTREKLAYDMLRFAGVCASHVCYVELWIDVHGDGQPAEYYGVYSLVERVDKKFLANRYGEDNKDGNLYKAAAWVEGSADLAYYGPDIEDYPTPHGEICYGKRTNEDEADYSDVIQLCYVIDGVEYDSPEDFALALEQVFNVDSLLRYMACVLSCSNLDIYIYTGNNYYLYNNPASGRFEWIPWDVNDSWGLFMDQEMNRNQPLYDWGGMPLTRRVIEVERYRRTYAAYVDLLRRQWFTPTGVRAQAQQWHQLVEPTVKQDSGDKMFFGESALLPISAFDVNWDTDWEQVFGVASLTQTRCDYIDAHLLADL